MLMAVVCCWIWYNMEKERVVAMMIGCLVGHGKRSLVDGNYAFCAPGLIDPLAPDLQVDCATGSGPLPDPP